LRREASLHTLLSTLTSAEPLPRFRFTLALVPPPEKLPKNPPLQQNQHQHCTPTPAHHGGPLRSPDLPARQPSSPSLSEAPLPRLHAAHKAPSSQRPSLSPPHIPQIAGPTRLLKHAPPATRSQRQGGIYCPSPRYVKYFR